MRFLGSAGTLTMALGILTADLGFLMAELVLIVAEIVSHTVDIVAVLVMAMEASEETLARRYPIRCINTSTLLRWFPTLHLQLKDLIGLRTLLSKIAFLSLTLLVFLQL